jgi:hypothetical protein
MRIRKPQGFAGARTKENLHLLPACLRTGSIFFWRPLHLSDRSRVAGPCLNISIVYRLAPGGCWSALPLVVGLHSVFTSVLRVVTVTSSYSCAPSGSKFAFQSSLVRGLCPSFTITATARLLCRIDLLYICSF